MKSGYKVVWTDHALDELSRTIRYLQLNFTEREINRLANKIEAVIRNISTFPKLYPESTKQKGVRRAVVARYNTLYYRIHFGRKQIEIVSFFSNRQDPNSLEF